MGVSRRRFLKGLMVGTATVAVSMRLAHGLPRLPTNYTWDSVNDDYSYGIDKEHPWDVVVFDEKHSDFITPDELTRRGHPFECLATDRSRKPSTMIPWDSEVESAEEWLRTVEMRAEAYNDLLAPVKPAGAELVYFSELPDDIRDAANAFDDDIDRAFLTVCAISMSQSMLGLRQLGLGSFDGPWKEMDDEIDTPRIITTNEDYFAQHEETVRGPERAIRSVAARGRSVSSA